VLFFALILCGSCRSAHSVIHAKRRGQNSHTACRSDFTNTDGYAPKNFDIPPSLSSWKKCRPHFPTFVFQPAGGHPSTPTPLLTPFCPVHSPPFHSIHLHPVLQYPSPRLATLASHAHRSPNDDGVTLAVCISRWKNWHTGVKARSTREFCRTDTWTFLTILHPTHATARRLRYPLHYPLHHPANTKSNGKKELTRNHERSLQSA
jgi:hypothetical protein